MATNPLFRALARFWRGYRDIARQMADDQAAGICPHCRKNPIPPGEMDCAVCHGEMSAP